MAGFVPSKCLIRRKGLVTYGALVRKFQSWWLRLRVYLSGGGGGGGCGVGGGSGSGGGIVAMTTTR